MDQYEYIKTIYILLTLSTNFASILPCFWICLVKYLKIDLINFWGKPDIMNASFVSKKIFIFKFTCVPLRQALNQMEETVM